MTGRYGTQDAIRAAAANTARELAEVRQRLGETAALHLAAAAERDRLAEGIVQMHTRLTDSSIATRPSRKSQIEDEIADQMQALLEAGQQGAEDQA